MLGDRKFEDLLQIRTGLEILAAELAATKVSDDGVLALRTYLSQMEDRKNDYAAFVEVDMLFHQTLASASGNETLSGLLQSVRSLLRLRVDRCIAKEQEALDAINEHSHSLRHSKPATRPLPARP